MISKKAVRLYQTYKPQLLIRDADQRVFHYASIGLHKVGEIIKTHVNNYLEYQAAEGAVLIPIDLLVCLLMTMFLI